MAINLNDYDITITPLSQFEDNDIKKWINSNANPSKVERELEKISQTGGKCTINNFDILSTDIVNVPFVFKNGNDWNIQIGKARHLLFSPSLEVHLKDVDMTKSVIDMSMEIFNIKKKEETVIPEIKEEKSVKEFNGEPSPKKKKKKSKAAESVIVGSTNLDTSLEMGPVIEKKKSKKRNHQESLQHAVKVEEYVTEFAETVEAEISSPNMDANNTEASSKKKNKKSKPAKEPVTDADANLDTSIEMGSVIEKKKSKKRHQIVKVEECVKEFVDTVETEKSSLNMDAINAESTPSSKKKNKKSKPTEPETDVNANMDTSVIEKKKSKKRHSSVKAEECAKELADAVEAEKLSSKTDANNVEATPSQKKNKKSKSAEFETDANANMDKSIEMGIVSEKKKSKKRHHSVKAEECAKEFAVAAEADISSPKKKKQKIADEKGEAEQSPPKKRKSNLVMEETAAPSTAEAELTKKKKKKSKVTFAEHDTAHIFVKDELIAPVIDLNLSSRLNASHQDEEGAKVHKKKKKHSTTDATVSN